VDVTVVPIALAVVSFVACASLGGGLYEFLVLDPVWPNRPAIIQPRNAGVSRRRFWIPVHAAFELSLVGALIISWAHPGIRAALLIALTSHVAMRVWSLVDLIPKAMAFERDDPATIGRKAAQRWVRRSALRLPLDAVTCISTLTALALS
jgi:hypothetical protein